MVRTAGLDEVDQQRLVFFERRAIVHWNHRFERRRRAQLPDDDWRELVWLIRAMSRNQGLKAAWDMFRDSFSPPFRELVDAQFAAADVSDAGPGQSPG